MRKFSKEEDAFIVANVGRYGCTQMARELGKRFGTPRSHQAVSRHCKEVLGIELTNPNRHQYTKEQIEFLRENISANSYNELRKKFNAKFGLKTTTKMIEKRCRRSGINHGHPGAKFVKGENNPFSPTRPLGSETVSAGKIYVKVADNPISADKASFGDGGNWVQKNRYVYEQTHGKIPDGYQIIALDGDRNNFDPGNLHAVPRRIGMMLGANKWYSDNPEITLTAIKWCELFYALVGCRKGGQAEEHD